MTNARRRQKQTTALALRAAAVRLMADRGYDATSTHEIARAAGVSPRTFFNYFPTKEAVVPLPDEFLSGIIERALRTRPADEELLVSLGAAATETVVAIASLPGAGDDLAARVALATVTTLTYLGLRTWAEGDGREPLVDVVARCLALTPDAARLGGAVPASRK